MRRVATLNQSFWRGAIAWDEWHSEVHPILCELNPELHHATAPLESSKNVEAFARITARRP